MIPNSTSEQDIVNAILQYLQLNRCLVWRQNQGGMKASYNGKTRFVRFSRVSGISDIIGMTANGRFLALEVKKPGKKPEPHQQEFLERVRAHGGIAECVHSIEEVQRILEEQYGAT